MIFQYPDPADSAAGVPQLCVEVVGDRRIVTVRASGEIDLATADLLDAGIAYGLRRRPARLVVHLAQVTFFSAAGLRALITARNEAAESDIDLVLGESSPTVRTVLDLSRTGGMFHVDFHPPPAARREAVHGANGARRGTAIAK